MSFRQFYTLILTWVAWHNTMAYDVTPWCHVRHVTQGLFYRKTFGAESGHFQPILLRYGQFLTPYPLHTGPFTPQICTDLRGVKKSAWNRRKSANRRKRTMPCHISGANDYDVNDARGVSTLGRYALCFSLGELICIRRPLAMHNRFVQSKFMCDISIWYSLK